MRSVQCERRRNPIEPWPKKSRPCIPITRELGRQGRHSQAMSRHIERERDEERVRRRLTVVGPRGARGEEGGAQEAGGGGAGHQPRAVLGQQQDGTVGRRVAGQRRLARGRAPRGLEQRAHRRRAIAPLRRCPTTTLPTDTTAHRSRAARGIPLTLPR